MFITIIAVVMTLSLISPSLVAFAAGGGAGGGFGGGGGSTSVKDNPINDEDIGLRFSLVTKNASGKAQVVQNIYGKYYVDVWDKSDYSDSWYGAVNAYSRYSPNPTAENIKYWNDVKFDNTIEGLITKSGKGSVDMNLSSLLHVGGKSAESLFTEGEGGLKINGDLFYSWFMEEAGEYDGESQSRYFFFITSMYMGKLNGINMKNTFLVVEPVLHLANPKTDDFTLLGTEYISSWYGYVEGNLTGRDLEPGSSFTLRDRFSNIANNFRVTETEYLNQDGMKDKMWEVLGVKVPDKLYEITGGLSIAYGNGLAYYRRNSYANTYNYNYRYNGFAMQIFWLKDIASSGDPIDTYDIDKKTTLTPDNAENPSDSNNNKGEKTIVKMYVDLYKDENTGYYSEIVDTATYARKNVSNLVSITDERNINGYNVAAWYTSKKQFSYDDGEVNNYYVMGSGMMAIDDFGGSKTDGTLSLSMLGGKQLRINNYTGLKCLPVGSQQYFTALTGKHGLNDIYKNVQSTEGATQYTNYKRLGFNGDTVYGHYTFKKDDDTKKTVDLGDDETLVVLYTRERTKLSTGDYSSSTNITTDTNKHTDKSGNLKIVKLYGVLNPSTYEITNDPSKSKVVISNATRNVNINSESGYDLAE